MSGKNPVLTYTVGEGNDQISLSSASKNNFIRYSAGDGKDTIWGFSENDTLNILADGYDTIRSGNDLLVLIRLGLDFAEGYILLKDVGNKQLCLTLGESGTSGGNSSSGGNGGGRSVGGTSSAEGKSSDASGGKSASGSSGGETSNSNSSNGNGNGKNIGTNSVVFSNAAPESTLQISNTNNQPVDFELADNKKISTTTSKQYPIHHIYRGNDQVILNYQSGENILFDETYTGSTFDDKGNFLAYSSTGTLVIENATDKFICLNDNNAYAFLKVYTATRPSVIDGRGLEGFEILNGSDVIYAGDGNSQLWGGNGFVSDTLVGGGGEDIFIGSKNQGSDFFLNVSSSDEVQLNDVTLNDIMKVEKNDDRIAFSLKTGNTVIIQSAESESGTIIFADTIWHFKHST